MRQYLVQVLRLDLLKTFGIGRDHSDCHEGDVKRQWVKVTATTAFSESASAWCYFTKLRKGLHHTSLHKLYPSGLYISQLRPNPFSSTGLWYRRPGLLRLVNFSGTDILGNASVTEPCVSHCPWAPQYLQRSKGENQAYVSSKFMDDINTILGEESNSQQRRCVNSALRLACRFQGVGLGKCQLDYPSLSASDWFWKSGPTKVPYE